MRKRFIKGVLAFLVAISIFIIFGKSNAMAVASDDVFADSIYVGGVSLSSGYYLESNSDLAVESIDDVVLENGYAFFDGATLELHNYKYSGEGSVHDVSEKSVIVAKKDSDAAIDTFTISLFGKNELINTHDNSLYAANGLYISGNLEIKGNGVLSLEASYGICISNDIFINYGKTTIKSTSCGIYAGGSLTINDGALNVYTYTSVYVGTSIEDSKISINGGSLMISSNAAAFNKCPTYTADVYNNSILTISENTDGSNPAASFDKTEFSKYKYFSLQEFSREKINDISVINFTEPGLFYTAYDIVTQSGLNYSLDAYECEGIAIEKLVDGKWVDLIELNPNYKLSYNEDYRLVLNIMPKDGYTINSIFDKVTGYINNKKVDVFEITEYAECYGAKIGYEFKYETTDEKIDNIDVTITLPKIGQVYSDLAYSKENVLCGEGYSYYTFSIVDEANPSVESSNFVKNTKYILTLVLEIEEGYYASNLDDLKINGNDISLYTIVENKIILSYTFIIPEEGIASVDINNVKIPALGQAFKDVEDFDSIVLGEGYELVNVYRYSYVNPEDEWTECNSDTVIKDGLYYSYTFVFKALDGYYFKYAEGSINELECVCWIGEYEGDDTVYFEIYYDFKYDVEKIESVDITNLKLPNVLDKFSDINSEDFITGEGYELSNVIVECKYGTDLLLENTVNYDITYTYTFIFVALDGYKFSEKRATINGENVECWYGEYDDGIVYFEVYYDFIYESDNKEITSIEISNYNIPNVGQKISEIDENDDVVYGGEYKIVDRRLIANGDFVIDYTGKIESGVNYELLVLVEPNDGYKFIENSLGIAFFNAYVTDVYCGVENGKVCYIVSYEFKYMAESEKKEISSIEISNVSIPNIGESYKTIIDNADSITLGEGYEIDDILLFNFANKTYNQYMHDDQYIKGNSNYVLGFILCNKDSYDFSSIIEAVSINGQKAYVCMIEVEDGVSYLYIEYHFSYIDYGISVAFNDENGDTVGVNITNANCNDVYGDGTVSYDPNTNTLTLNNYQYKGEGLNFDNYIAIFVNSELNSFTLNLVGENSITVSSEYSIGIFALGVKNFVVNGDGKLNINTSMLGIQTDNYVSAFKLLNGDISINVNGSPAGGIICKDFIMYDGRLNITTSYIGIGVFDEESNLTFKGGKIEINTSFAGFMFVYNGTEPMTFVSVAPKLEFEHGCSFIAGTKEDGSDASLFDENNLATYRYAFIEHSCNFGDEWLKDTVNHYKECDCGQKNNVGVHTDANNDGKCDVCEYNMPITSKPTTTPTLTPSTAPVASPSTTTPNESENNTNPVVVVVIIVASTLALGAGGFSVYWFVIKKRKLSDLFKR